MPFALLPRGRGKMLLCFNRGCVKQMAALLLQVISVGTAINFVVPYCCRCGTSLTHRAAILLKPSSELMTFWTKGTLAMHWGPCEASLSACVCTWWHTGWSCILHFPCLRSHVLSPSEMFSAQALMDMGQFARTFQGFETLFCLDFFLIKWIVLSSFISFQDEFTLMAATHSTWQEIKENFSPPKLPE